jgi:hypothetical protein
MGSIIHHQPTTLTFQPSATGPCLRRTYFGLGPPPAALWIRRARPARWSAAGWSSWTGVLGPVFAWKKLEHGTTGLL